MSHEIENAIYSQQNGVAWHGLGAEIPADAAHDPVKLATLLKLDWTVDARAAYYENADGQFVPVPERVAQVRSDTGRALSFTSSTRYHTTNRQPRDLLADFVGKLNEAGAELSHGAVLRGGAVLAFSSKLPETGTVGTEKVSRYLTLATSYDKSLGTPSFVTDFCVVCANTLRAGISDTTKSGKLRVLRASTELAAGDIRRLLDDAETAQGPALALYNRMQDQKISDADATRYFANVLDLDMEKLGKTDAAGKLLVSTKQKNMLDALVLAYRRAPGAAQRGNTVWGALNAVTYFATHEKTCRDTDNSGEGTARVASNLFGSASQLKAKALQQANMLLAA